MNYLHDELHDEQRALAVRAPLRSLRIAPRLLAHEVYAPDATHSWLVGQDQPSQGTSDGSFNQHVSRVDAPRSLKVLAHRTRVQELALTSNDVVESVAAGLSSMCIRARQLPGRPTFVWDKVAGASCNREERIGAGPLVMLTILVDCHDMQQT